VTGVALAPAAPTAGTRLLEAGRLREARVAFWAEAEAAEAAGEVERLAEAALGLGGLWVHEHRLALDRARVTALQARALTAVPAGWPVAARLRIRLAAEHAYASGSPAGILSELDRARAAGEPVALADALSLAHHCLLAPHHAEARLALADELIAVSPHTGRAIDGSTGLMWRSVDLLLAGDRRAERSLAELRERLQAAPCDALDYVVAALDVMRTIRRGQLDEAEAMAEACLRLGEDVGDVDALGWYGAQLLVIRWLQGRGRELLPLVGELARSTTVAESSTGFAAASAVLAAAAGEAATATGVLAGLGADGLGAVPRSSIWLATMFGVCEAAHLLGDAAVADEAGALLAAFVDRPVMASLGVACFGSAHRPAGLAAMTAGRVDEAVAHLEAAVAADLALGHLPMHAVNRATLADVLDQRAGPGDRDRARALRTEATADAHRLGLSGRAAGWARPDEVDADAGVDLRRDGRFWRVVLADRSAVVPDSVGMGYLRALVERPGREVTALDLTGAPVGPTRTAEPVLDDRARAAYRRRIEELEDDLADADLDADLERAARARHELDQFLAELARTTGFAGRPRSFVDDAERARVSVCKAIKRALTSIAEADPLLGRVLRARVVTGPRCVYRAPA